MRGAEKGSAVHNADIARVFDEIADLLEIQGENPFRIRAYRNAARTVNELPRDLKVLLDGGADLPKLPGVGEDLAEKIQEICGSGSCALLAKLHKTLPAAITALLTLPGLGPKRVKVLHERLKVNTLADLERALKSGRVREIPGFGQKTEQHILEALAARSGESARFKLSTAMQYAVPLVAHLKRVHGVREATAAGSLRRRRETEGDLDIVVAAGTAAPVMEAFCTYEEVGEVRARGDTRSTVILKSGLQVDLRVIRKLWRSAALLHRFESAQHRGEAPRTGPGTQDQRVRRLPWQATGILASQAAPQRQSYPQDRTFLVIELDELIERHGMQASARDFTGRARA